MEQDDHQQIGQVPEPRTLALDARERQLQREPVADGRTRSDLTRTLRLRDLTFRAQDAIARADQHILESEERLNRSATVLRTCFERLRWTSAELGSDVTLAYSRQQQGGGRHSNPPTRSTSVATAATDRSSA